MFALTCRATSALFSRGEKCEKTLAQARHAMLRMALKHQDLGENRESPGTGMSTICSEPNAVEILSWVKTLRTSAARPSHDAQLERQRSARQCAAGAGTETRRSALQPTVPPSAGDADQPNAAGYGCSTSICVSRSLNSWSSQFPVCGTGASRICTSGQISATCSKACRSIPPVAPTAHTDRVAGNRPGERGASGTSPCSSTRSGPCHLRALCAVVLRLGKGHCDCRPLMAKK